MRLLNAIPNETGWIRVQSFAMSRVNRSVTIDSLRSSSASGTRIPTAFPSKPRSEATANNGAAENCSAVSELGRSAKSGNANGVLSSSPGLRRQALPWGDRPRFSSTPTGLCPCRCRHRKARTPLGFIGLISWLPRVGSCVAATLGWRTERRWCSSRFWPHLGDLG